MPGFFTRSTLSSYYDFYVCVIIIFSNYNKCWKSEFKVQMFPSCLYCSNLQNQFYHENHHRADRHSNFRFTANMFTHMQCFPLFFSVTLTQVWNVKAACCGFVFIMTELSLYNTMLNERPAELWGKVPAPERKWKWGWWVWRHQVLLVKLPAHAMNISLLKHSSLSLHTAPPETNEKQTKEDK